MASEVSQASAVKPSLIKACRQSYMRTLYTLLLKHILFMHITPPHLFHIVHQAVSTPKTQIPQPSMVWP
jgi:hypothetical protein